MTPSEGSFQRPRTPRSASPAERAQEFANAQRRLKEEAAERRVQAASRASEPKTPRRSAAGKKRGRG